MNIFRPELTGFGAMPDLKLTVTHPAHMASESADFLSEGNTVSGNGKSADSAKRSGSFGEAMLSALDSVSASQQFSSKLAQTALTDPDSVNVEDISIAMAQASASLNLTRNVLSRLVQGWRDVINTR